MKEVIVLLHSFTEKPVLLDQQHIHSLVCCMEEYLGNGRNKLSFLELAIAEEVRMNRMNDIKTLKKCREWIVWWFFISVYNGFLMPWVILVYLQKSRMKLASWVLLVHNQGTYISHFSYHLISVILVKDMIIDVLALSLSSDNCKSIHMRE